MEIQNPGDGGAGALKRKEGMELGLKVYFDHMHTVPDESSDSAPAILGRSERGPARDPREAFQEEFGIR